MNLAMAGKLKSALKKDQNHWYALNEPVYYIGISTDHFAPFYYEDEVLYIEPQNTKTSDGKLKFDIVVKPFEWKTRFWDGTSFLPDNGTKTLDALFRASLLHDVIYERVEQISKTTGIPQDKLLAFADDCLKIIADYNGATPLFTRIVHSIVRFGGSLYHRIKKMFAVSLIFALYSTGCYSIQTSIDEIPTIINYSGPFTAEQELSTTNANSVENLPPDKPDVGQYSTNSIPSITIKSFGSPDVSKASEHPQARIKSLKINNDGLAYSWKQGSCQLFGAASSTDYSQTLAVAGYSTDGKTYRCAKFDWISTSRTTRDFKNIADGYNGWDHQAFHSAPFKCFYILSSDGKWRTNVLTTP